MCGSTIGEDSRHRHARSDGGRDGVVVTVVRAGGSVVLAGTDIDGGYGRPAADAGAVYAVQVTPLTSGAYAARSAS
jgi:hypothetical protein